MSVLLLRRRIEVGKRCNCLVDEGQLLGVHVKSNTELAEERQAESQVLVAQGGIVAPWEHKLALLITGSIIISVIAAAKIRAGLSFDHCIVVCGVLEERVGG